VSGARRRKPPEPLDAARAWDYALWLLGRQSYSATEIERRLLRRKLPAADAERVVARLIELQLLDDERFATSFVRSRKTAKGPLALRSMLRQRGVSDDVVHAALEAEGEVRSGRRRDGAARAPGLALRGSDLGRSRPGAARPSARDGLPRAARLRAGRGPRRTGARLGRSRLMRAARRFPRGRAAVDTTRRRGLYSILASGRSAAW
jgi:hypothetical protein